jgi:4-hydroxy-3-polyprenylbenzoate decarboxylase
MTGASGQLYGIRALELLSETGLETHLIRSEAASVTLEHEAADRYSVAALEDLADTVHDNDAIGAAPASGSFRTEGMLVAPCSMKTLAKIATGDADNLIARSADVTLKQRRPLVVMPREKPLNRIHLENMLAVTDAGGIVMPPFPSFYANDDTLDAMITRTVARALEFFDVDVEYEEWEGLDESSE